MKGEKLDKNYPYKLAELRDRKGDVSKEWYIEYYVFDESINDLVRKRIKIPTKYQSPESKRKYAAKEIKETNEVLRNGFYIKSAVSEPDAPKELPFLTDALEDMISILKSELRPDTIDSYKSAISKITEYDQPVRINEIDTQYVYHFRDYMLRNGAKARNANNIVSHLRAMFTRLMERHSVAENPFKIKFLQVAQVTNSNIAFTDEDREVMEKYLLQNDYELYLFTRYIYYAFVRPKELRFLRVSAIRANEGIILMPGDVSKNKKTEQISIITALLALIEKSVSNEPQRFFLFGKGMKPGDIKMSVNYAYERHQKALGLAGLGDRPYTLYSWKHTGAVNAYLSGVGIKQLQLILRHSTVQMTDIYLKSLGLRTDPNIGNYNW